MTAVLIVCAAVFGLVIGSFLNVVAYRVPAHIPLSCESRCPRCGAPIRWYQNVPVVSWLALRGRCASCRTPIPVRYPVVEAITGAAFVVVAWWILTTGAAGVSSHGGARSVSGTFADPVFWIVLVAYLYFAAISIVLTLIDVDVHRLPNGIVLPAYPVAGILLLLACAVGAPWANLLRAGIAMAALYVFYFVIRLISPRGMGGGDVKLAGVVGIYLGWAGWSSLAVGAFAAFALGGLFGLLLILARRAGRKTAIPFGPWMLAGAWVGLFLGGPIGQWYLALYA